MITEKSKAARSFDTRVDTFMPDDPVVTVNQPIHPGRKQEEEELTRRFQKAYEGTRFND